MEGRPVATSDDVELLISELAASLIAPQRYAFLDAARAALAAAGCSGCGAAYRVLAPLQRGYWDPPADNTEAHAGARHHRSSKLRDLPAVGAEDPRTGARDRHRLRAM
jgi:hypothetical protein